jgi:hypothetical protein
VITRASLIARLSKLPAAYGNELAALPKNVDFVEVPSSLVDALNLESLRRHFAGGVLFEIDVERDLDEELLCRIPVEQRIVSWQGEASDVAHLQRKVEEISAVPLSTPRVVLAKSFCR